MKKAAKKSVKKVATKKAVVKKSATKKIATKTAKKSQGKAAAAPSKKPAPIFKAVAQLLHPRVEGELRAASWNVNGIRSVFGKGLVKWISESDLDVVMLQEVKATSAVMVPDLENFPETTGFLSATWASAEKPGYSGLLTLCRKQPDAIRIGMGETKFDSEGRWLEVDLGNYTFINSYFPNSQRDSARLSYKLEFCAAAKKRMHTLEDSGRIVVLAGDINVAHTEIDLANPKTNTKNAGFLPEERAWFTEFINSGWVDVFREFEKGPHHYTWWSYRPGVREKNVGWRLDHFFISGKAKDHARWMMHQPHVTGSDHCPIIMSVKV